MGVECGGVGAGLSLGHRQAPNMVELGPILGDVAGAVVERHGLRLENRHTCVIDAGKLHQLAAVNLVVVRKMEVVVGPPYVMQRT